MNDIDKFSEEEKQKDVREEILEGTGREYFSAGLDELSKRRCNSAVVLFFKSLTTFTALLIFKEQGKAPSSHNERFRVTQKDFSDVYDLLDKDFPFYQDSYGKIMSEELAEVIKDDAETVAQKTGIKL